MSKEKIKIDEIEVEDLFGCYSYLLQAPEESNFMILYGDNGCGKSSILSTIFHLLNPERTNGHRTAVSQIPFKKITIKLSNGDAIEASRNNAHDEKYIVKGIKKNNVMFTYIWEERTKIRSERHYESNEIEYERYCQYLSTLRLNTLFMPADRQLISYFIPGNHQVINYDNDDLNLIIDHPFNITRTSKQSKGDDLSDVMDNFQRWMQRNVVKNTNEGYRNIDELYEGIINKYNSKQNSSTADIKTSFSDLTERNKNFKRLGLSTDILTDTFISKIQSMTNKKMQELAPVLESYVSSLNIRLEALQPIESKLSILEKYLSKFFSRKKVRINALDGLLITSLDGETLHYSKLSSGEKQVLYLFCSIITSVSKSSIVIIDEPEISLNIKWQREFLNVVNEMIGENNVQVIIASHSIELITPYKGSVVKMEQR